ncbi:MAG TPA: transcription-repair coupling factor [Rickettsiales bacterium]|nr:transcription-repair coupling factor [Rickettsiales bacterium]
MMSPAEHTELHGVPQGSEGYVLAGILQVSAKDIIFIASSDRDMEMVRAGLEFFAPDVKIITLPAWDCLPYDRASPNAAVLAARIVALSQILAPTKGKRAILTTVNAALQKLPPKTLMQRAHFSLKTGAEFSHDALTHFLIENGYRRNAKTMEAGEFAVRGSIIDIIPPGMADGVRLDAFGNTLESIRLFDPISQLTKDKLNEIMLHPASEVLLNETTIKHFREQYRNAFGAITREDPIYDAISEGRGSHGMEHLLPLFYESLDTLFDYVPEAKVILGAQARMACRERLELTQEYYAARKNIDNTKHYGAAPYPALPPDALYLNEGGWESYLTAHHALAVTPFVSEGKPGMNYRPARNFAAAKLTGEALFDDLRHYSASERSRGRSTIIACYSQGSRERIATMLHEHELHPLRIDSFNEVKNISGKTIGLAIIALERGFEADTVTLLSEQDLFGERIIRSSQKRKKAENFLSEAASFMPGELVVHKEHGIGRFEGLITLEVLGAQHDCLKIIYEGDDKLFLPVENIEVISRFGSEEEGAKLDKLGSASWQARKAKLKERITIAAEELLRTAAAREISSAPPFEPPQGLYDEFCARFPYAETEDQAKAIEDILADIASGKPTDRLVCGDVGFGKTEVALRAAFVAACANTERGKVQVAVICPTTLLCRQHYHTFSERFSGMPFTIRHMSRLTTAKENKKTLEGLENGSIDIVIGTHALLGKNVKFKNLGMLIIDEEQHFGVAQKEKLKSLRSDIHVITLSATPIPRTLQLALSGVRELSIIATPPVDRLAVRTFVTPFDSVVLREAILREYHRGGRIFYVTPRIKYMAELQTMLREIVPEIRVATANGQMPPAELDDIMNKFYDGSYDLLLSTTIVESGLDIPTANTIIVDRAEMFGLSQLYQLRGRVGRGKTRAYAYYTLPHRKQLSRAATRRLEVMQTLDSLGAGFTLASHDMDIRGFGNLVGEEQSGHVREVGIELYQQMLEEAVAGAKAQRKGEKPAASDEWSPQINLGMTVLIPEAYVQDLEMRLGLYRRAASLATEEEIHAFAAELIDRFGKLPREVEHLLAVMRIKQLCRKAGIERIDAGPKGLLISLRNNTFAAPEKLLAYIAKNAAKAKIRPDQKLFLSHEFANERKKLQTTREAVEELASLI